MTEMITRKMNLYIGESATSDVDLLANDIADYAITNVDSQLPTSKKEYRELYGEPASHFIRVMVSVTVNSARKSGYLRSKTRVD